jgi:hypothetical protein
MGGCETEWSREARLATLQVSHPEVHDAVDDQNV